MGSFTIELGATVKDTITGFKGVITGRCEYVTGCRTYLVQPKAVKGEFKSALWMDEDRLTVTKDAPKPKKKKTPTGGPQEFEPPAK